MTEDKLIKALWVKYGRRCGVVGPYYGNIFSRDIAEKAAFEEAIIEALATKCEELEPYCRHDTSCPMAMCSEGRPTADGGYEWGYGYGESKQWYPDGEHPPCTCGLLAALNAEPEEA